MPYVYRFTRPIPRTLDYRDAVVTLEIVKQPSEIAGESWMLRARKIGETRGEPCVIFSLGLSREIFDHTLTHNGFTVPRGSPAEKIMDRLVREGHAQRVFERS